MLFSPKELVFVVNALRQRLAVWFVSAKIPTLTVVARQMFPWKDMREKEELSLLCFWQAADCQGRQQKNGGIDLSHMGDGQKKSRPRCSCGAKLWSSTTACLWFLGFSVWK